MAENEQELENEVRGFTGIDTAVVNSQDFQAVLSDAKRHIVLSRSLNDEEIDWYGEDAQQDALNWATKLFLKVAAGELDSQTIQVGAIDHDTLKAKDDNSYTIWYRQMQAAMNRIKPRTTYGVSSTERRTYTNYQRDRTTNVDL
jgi:hypothetical protein